MKRLLFILAFLLAVALFAVSAPGRDLTEWISGELSGQRTNNAGEMDSSQDQEDENYATVITPTPTDNGAGEVQTVHIDEDEEKGLEIPVLEVSSDMDGDGIADLADIVEGALLDAQNKPRYKDAYYSGGYPPDDEGVCTDVLWRAFKNAGYWLKDMIDDDIRNNTDLYPRVGGRPDPNIDFRRIQNLIVFFKRHAEVLTTELIPGDAENLVQWQGGDIIIFLEPYEHTGILSGKRNEDGVPYLIHNGGPYTREEDILPRYLSSGYEIAWHFRFPKEAE